MFIQLPHLLLTTISQLGIAALASTVYLLGNECSKMLKELPEIAQQRPVTLPSHKKTHIQIWINTFTMNTASMCMKSCEYLWNNNFFLPVVFLSFPPPIRAENPSPAAGSELLGTWGRKHPLIFLYLVSKSLTLRRILMICSIGQLVEKTQRQKDFLSRLQNRFFWITGRRGRTDKLALFRRQWLRLSRAEPGRENVSPGRKFAFMDMG